MWLPFLIIPVMLSGYRYQEIYILYLEYLYLTHAWVGSETWSRNHHFFFFDRVILVILIVHSLLNFAKTSQVYFLGLIK